MGLCASHADAIVSPPSDLDSSSAGLRKGGMSPTHMLTKSKLLQNGRVIKNYFWLGRAPFAAGFSGKEGLEGYCHGGFSKDVA